MNPEIWGKLPQDLIERVASFADFDTRRALGITPRKLPRSDFVPRPIKPTTFRYFSAIKKLVYINFAESYDVYAWEAYDNVERMDDDEWGGVWSQGPGGRHRGVWRGLDDFMYFDTPALSCPIHFAGVPEIIST